MSERAEKFFVAFFGTLILFVVGTAIAFGFAYCVVRFGPLISFPVGAILLAAFAGAMHAGSNGEAGRGE